MSSRRTRRTSEVDFRIRQQVTIGGDIASKDPDYARYAGAYVGDALEMANIDYILRVYNLPPEISVMLKARRYYLDLRRKAYFCSIGSDIFSKLAFIQGDTRKKARWR